MTSTVAFFFFMLVKNEHSEIWTLSTVCGLALIVVLTYEWLMALVYFVVGLLVACCLVLLTSSTELELINYEHLPVYLFIIIGGSLFSYRNNIVFQEKLLKAIGSSISSDMETPLVKVKTAIEDLADEMGISKKHVQKEVLEVLSGRLKRLSVELEKTQSELLKSEKMAALGRAVARIAHELNTPLGAARMSAFNIATQVKKLLEKINGLDPENVNLEHLEEWLSQFDKDMTKMQSRIEGNLVRAADLVENFKKISTDQIHVQRRAFELYDYLETIIRTMNHALKRKKIDVHLKGDNILLNSDPSIFHHIIENLMTNAEKYAYGHQGGRIDIVVQDGEDQIVLFFKDYGKGIPQENLSKIFDAFFTTGGGKGGTGLGLNIVYTAVRSLKGTITCESTEGEGTTFTLIIPKNS